MKTVHMKINVRDDGTVGPLHVYREEEGGEPLTEAEWDDVAATVSAAWPDSVRAHREHLT